ncbi:YidC/Oxa1 family membrane protein insertase [Selenomonadales bacterium OttesenSCG-928-I06]|nr:YidC/Oxa1 family membrane protein insertase [Selenomonadales bacterium OttesenSCG-928-I06]
MASILMFFYSVTEMVGYPNFGLAIILFTIVIKIILYPMTVKQTRSMKAIQDIQPKVKAIQDKYKGDSEKLGREMTKLYKESGINPIAGCLPLLVQMPFLIIIFWALKDFNYAGVINGFIWITDLSLPDPFYILPVLAVVTTFVQQKQVMSNATGSSKMMLYMMPLFIGWISVTFPSGLVIYWVTNNILQIIQQWYINRGDAALVSKEAK